MPLPVQDLVVTVIASGCAVFICRRVLGLVRPAARPGCTTCASGEGCAPAGVERDGNRSSHPLVFVRSEDRPER